MLIALSTKAQFNEDLDAAFGDVNALTRRDDQIWSSESANVVYKEAGNVSILSDSRYGMSDFWEISTNLGSAIWVPRVSVKRLMKVVNRKNYFAIKGSASTAISGYSIARNHHYDKLINQDDDLPFVLDLTGELIYSRAFRNDPNCAKDNVWLVLSNSISLDTGFDLNGKKVKQAGYQFLANRSGAWRDWGVYLRVKVWADWLVNSWLIVRGGLKYYYGTFVGHDALEGQVEAEAFLTGRLSFKAGGILSYANYNTVDKDFAAYPMVDITYYFGKKVSSREGRLFDLQTTKKMKNRFN